MSTAAVRVRRAVKRHPRHTRPFQSYPYPYPYPYPYLYLYPYPYSYLYPTPNPNPSPNLNQAHASLFEEKSNRRKAREAQAAPDAASAQAGTPPPTAQGDIQTQPR